MKPLKIIPPLPERVKVYEQYVKPLLKCAVDNNAIDKWMFNIYEGREVNRESVVYVSTKHKKFLLLNL